MPDAPTIRPRDMLAASALVGLAVGLAEAALIASFKIFNARVTMDDLRVNVHASWMIPATDLALFLAIGVLLAGLARRRPNLAKKIAGPSLAIPAFAALLLHASSLHWAARWVLAIGLGIQAARLAGKLGPGLAQKTLRLAPSIVILAITLGAAEFFRVSTYESRSIAAAPNPAAKLPNVLLLVLDTVRADHLSVYGYERDTTPNLARLAKNGVRFDAAIAPAPWTLPSHASMFTGKWPHELSTRVDRPLDRNDTTIAESLAGQGYATAGFVANTYYCNASYGIDRGFAHYEDFPQNARVSFYEMMRSASLGKRLLIAMGKRDHAYAGEKSTRKTASRMNNDLLSWIDTRADRSRPFFGFVNYYDAHGPYQPPKDAPRRFGLSTLPENEREKILSEKHRITSRKPVTPLDAGDEAWMKRATDLVIDTYDDCLAQLDREIGELFHQLESRGLRDNTIIIVTADHGEHFGEHGLFGHGLSLYQPEVHVPLLIFAPNAPKGSVIAEPVSLRDLPATIADLSGSESATPFPGRSLATLFDGSQPSANAVLTEVEHQKKFSPSPNIPASRGPVQGMIDGRWSYFRNADGSEELYDLRSDPKETVNVFKSSREDGSRLRTAMERVDKNLTRDDSRTAEHAPHRVLK